MSMVTMMIGIKSNIFVLLFLLPMEVDIDGNNSLLSFTGRSMYLLGQSL